MVAWTEPLLSVKNVDWSRLTVTLLGSVALIWTNTPTTGWFLLSMSVAVMVAESLLSPRMRLAETVILERLASGARVGVSVGVRVSVGVLVGLGVLVEVGS